MARVDVSRRASATEHQASIFEAPDGDEVIFGVGSSTAYQDYIGELSRRGWFPDRVDDLRRLGALAPSLRETDDGRPRIGIAVSDPDQMFDGPEGPVHYLCKRLRALGCRPLIIPPSTDILVPDTSRARTDAARAIIAPLDAVIGLGGADVHPRLYRSRVRHANETNYPRDRFEAQLMLEAMSADLFMLGICRSHQLWNAIRGGEIIQDIEAEGYASSSRRQRKLGQPMSGPCELFAPGNQPWKHEVTLTPGSRISKDLGGTTSLHTNAAYHQAVKTAGRGLKIVGTVTDPVTLKRTVQATEGPKIVTVQFHPELRRQSPPDEALISLVARRAHIYRAIRDMREAEKRVTARTVSDELRANPSLEFTAEDFEWLKRDGIRTLSRV